MSKLSWKCIYHTNKIEQIFFPDTTENENKISALSFSREISPLNLKKKKKTSKLFPIASNILVRLYSFLYTWIS